MEEAQLRGLQDRFTCSVCMDTLSDPVSIPCGHSFCLKCLTNYWDQSQVCSCPQCRENFTTRPELRRNTLDPLSQNYAGPEDVECDVCTGKKFRAVKSCLTCMASFCQTHLLEIYCRTDDMCIFAKCVVTEHNGHKIVELETEREEKQVSGMYCLMGEDQRRREINTTQNACQLLGPRKPSFRFSSEEAQHMEAPRAMEKCTQCPLRHKLYFINCLSDFIPLTMDPNTVNCYLRLCEKNKKVTWEMTETEYPDHPDRFEYLSQVLCREALTGNHRHWEVECIGDYVSVGVSYQGLSRNGLGNECGLGNNDKSWCLSWVNSQIGVYLDWPVGSLSFYSVSHTMTLLQTFNTSFIEPLYLGFWLGCDSSVTNCPLIACEC
uniref:Uncharacterized protein n=1 Tax=Erpetoichthys calabaricus TaxID=27687 RepID=A0A8C4ST05_ERPCA